MIKIKFVNNKGDLAKEYVLLTVEADCNLGDYLLTDSTYGSNEAPSNKLRHVFFFPSVLVQKGERVVLWTRNGKYVVSKTATNIPQHNFFWSLQETVWNIKGDKAFLFNAPRALRSSMTIVQKAP